MAPIFRTIAVLAGFATAGLLCVAVDVDCTAADATCVPGATAPSMLQQERVMGRDPPVATDVQLLQVGRKEHQASHHKKRHATHHKKHHHRDDGPDAKLQQVKTEDCAGGGCPFADLNNAVGGGNVGNGNVDFSINFPLAGNSVDAHVKGTVTVQKHGGAGGAGAFGVPGGASAARPIGPAAPNANPGAPMPVPAMGAGLPKAAPMPGGLPKAAPMPAMGAGGAGGPGGPAKPSGRWVWVPHGGKAPKNDDGEKKDAEEKTSDDSEEKGDDGEKKDAEEKTSDDSEKKDDEKKKDDGSNSTKEAAFSEEKGEGSGEKKVSDDEKGDEDIDGDDGEKMADLMAQIPAKTHASDDPLEGSKKGSEVASDQEVGAKEASKKDSEVGTDKGNDAKEVGAKAAVPAAE